MKTTLDLPDELVATLETTAAREQRDVSEVAREALARGLAESAELHQPSPTSAEERRRAADEWLRGWQALGARITRKGVDPRSMVETLKADRASRS